MHNLIDLHCHLLPGIDDGPRTLEESLAIARSAVRNGITHAVATPHIQPGRYDNNRESITRSFLAFRDALASADIGLEVGMAAEVHLDPDILSLLQEQQIPFLGELDGYQIMLLEFPQQTIPPGSIKFVEHLLSLGIRPLIAHPERHSTIKRDANALHAFIEVGCMLQITASALTGRYGKRACYSATELLQKDAYCVLASDAHDLGSRPPELKSGIEAAGAIIGSAAAEELAGERCWAIVQHQF